MKKKIIWTLFCFFYAYSALSQNQDPWVGDWTSEAYTDIDWEASNATKDANGTIQEVIDADYRLIIRITKNGDNYTVRGKTIKVGNSDYIQYSPRFTVTRMEGNKMWLQASESKRPFVSNGEIDEYSDLTWYYTLTLENGALHYVHYHTHSINYDRHIRYKDEDDWDTSTWKDGHNLMLYNDDW